jgi:hypothetical protein
MDRGLRYYKQALHLSEHEQYYKHTSRRIIITLKYYRYSNKNPRESSYIIGEYQRDFLL